MSTLVKFYIDQDIYKGEIFAYFPQLNYNKHLYGNTVKTGYAHIGQHTSINADYIKNCKSATPSEYEDLKMELEGLDYKLKILNKGCRISKYIIPSYWTSALYDADYSNMLDTEIDQLNDWLAKNDPGNIIDIDYRETYMQFENLGHTVVECTFIKF